MSITQVADNKDSVAFLYKFTLCCHGLYEQMNTSVPLGKNNLSEQSELLFLASVNLVSTHDGIE